MGFIEDQKETREKFNKRYWAIIRKENNVCAFKYKWFDCLTYRVLWHVNWYVGIPKDHPFYGKSFYYSDYSDEVELSPLAKHINSLSVHGWLTRSDEMKLVSIEWYDFSWCFGFDTAHARDAFDAWSYINYNEWRDEYRTQEYVINEIKSLVDQILLFPII